MPASRTAAPLTLDHIRAAHGLIKGRVHRTPIFTSTLLNSATGATIYFKCENLQKTGAFKARGAMNAVFSLTDEEASRGVVTHSSGNHGAALARAAGLRGIPAFIVMPANAPKTKQAAVAGYGGSIVFCEPTVAAREAACAKLISETGARLVHPYNDYRVMAGQGTAALELLEDVPDLEMVLVPVGGGGLLSGTAVASKGLRPTILVIAVEPERADDACQSFKSGRRIATVADTIADGLRTTLGELNFPLIQSFVDDIVTVSEDSIVRAMRRIWETMKVVIEPSAAVAPAAIFERKVSAMGRKVGVILSGGNVDLDALPWRKP
jgi:threonine dehydratase